MFFTPLLQGAASSGTGRLVCVNSGKPRNSQPSRPTQIDRSNPLTLGLVKAINAATLDRSVTLAGSAPTPMQLTTPIGVGLSANGATSYYVASPTALASLNPTWTILTIVSNFTGSAGGGGYGLYVERPNSTQIIKIVVGMNLTFSNAEFTTRDLSSNLVQMRPSYTSGGGPNVSDGHPHVMAFTRRASNDHRGWIDGREVVSNTATNISGAFAATNATIGIDLFDTLTFNGAVPLVLVWNRSLSDKELASISRNPWQVFKAANTPIYLSTAATGAVTLTPSLYTNTNSFFTPTITTGAVTLTPSLYTNTNSFFAPTITTGAVTLTPSLYTNTVTLFAPTVTTAAFTLTPSLYTNSSSFFVPTITVGTVTLTPTLYSNTVTLFTPTLIKGAVTLTPSLYTNTVTLFAPTLTTGVVTLSTTLYSNTITLFPPSLVGYVWQDSVIKYVSATRTKLLAVLSKFVTLTSLSRTKLFIAGIKTAHFTSASRTKVLTVGIKTAHFTSNSRSNVFFSSLKTKVFTTTPRG